MSDSKEQVKITQPPSLQKLSVVFMFLGAVSLLGSFLLEDSQKTASAYLVSFVYFLFLSLGALFFLSVQYVTNAVWSVNLRRVMESLSAYLPFSAVLLIPLVYYGQYLYEWFHPSHVENDPLLMGKTAYLNVPFFLIRLILFFGGWLVFYKKFIQFSRRQSAEGSMLWMEKAKKYSVGFLLFFVLSFSFLSVDLLMSLDAHWFSTIFGVYTFAGSFQSALALMILLTVYMIPRSKGQITKDHLHDLGKFLMGMTLFWAYIAFSQYMLIWYANLPEETTFFVPRSKGPWMWVSISLIVFKFAVPFVCLLPRWVKRNTAAVSSLSVLILIMQYVDIYWLVYPSLDGKTLRWDLLDLGFFLGFLGLFVHSVFKFFSQHSAVPVRDPMSGQSAKHHVTY